MNTEKHLYTQRLHDREENARILSPDPATKGISFDVSDDDFLKKIFIRTHLPYLHGDPKLLCERCTLYVFDDEKGSERATARYVLSTVLIG